MHVVCACAWRIYLINVIRNCLFVGILLLHKTLVLSLDIGIFDKDEAWLAIMFGR